MKKGIERSNLDESVDLKDDFYGFASGGWRKKHPLPADFSQYGVFSMLGEKAREDVREIIENASKLPEASEKGSVAQKISDLYAMGLDMERRNREGNLPLQPILERIENYDKSQLADTVAWLAMGLDSTFFGYGVGPDQGNSNMNILHLMEASLGLGDRDYYLEKNDTNDKILAAYRQYITRIMSLAGYSDDDAKRISETVIDTETEFARHKKTREERRDPEKGYHIMTLEEVERKWDAFPWREIFRKSGIPDVGSLNVSSPGFMDFINGYFPKLSDRQVKDLMAYGAVSSSAGVLDDDFYDAQFEMFSRVISGVEEKKPLWKRAMAIPNSMFGEEVGQLYVQSHFPQENKEYMVRLVNNLKDALATHISNLSWMGEATKAKALEKLSRMKYKIGYPDTWKDHSEIKIDPNDYYMTNILKASEWFTRDNFSKAGKPVDETEWFMTPQTVNAYYSPLNNEICFPAAILQPPFFDINADDAMNYGGIGVVIGHEMTHGFDDQGRKYDADGNLRNWWEEEDAKKFESLADKIVDQFNAVEVAPGVHANGKYTLGENIADQGGLRVAMTAYDKAASDSNQSQTAGDDGFTPEQRFYLSYGQIWASNIRPEEILTRTQTDPHSLAENRVNVTLKNIGRFQRAFGIKEGDAMYLAPEERVTVW